MLKSYTRPRGDAKATTIQMPCHYHVEAQPLLKKGSYQNDIVEEDMDRCIIVIMVTHVYPPMYALLQGLASYVNNPPPT